MIERVAEFHQLHRDWRAAEDAASSARNNHMAAVMLYPTPLLRREQSVWSLYASGQGDKVGSETAGLRTFERVLCWLANQSLPRVYGSFDSFSICEMQPIDSLSPNEHYWGQAIKVASDNYGIDLTWKCGCCDGEQTGCDEGGPTFTGYRGNGGIGVFMEGAICRECLDNGSCPACSARGCADHERWDQDVLNGSRFLCEHCERELLKTCGIELTSAGEKTLDSGDKVELKYAVREPRQTTIPGVEDKLELMISVDGALLSPDDYIVDLDAFWAAWDETLGCDAGDMRRHLEYGLPFPDMVGIVDTIEEEVA